MKIAYLFFAISVIIYPLCHIMLRIGMKQVGQITTVDQLFRIETIVKVLTNPYVMGAIFVLVLNLALMLVVVSNFNVSYFYPFGAVAYIVAAILALVILHEPITFTRWLGIVVITLGAILLNLDLA